jgi:hypothetical protein
MGDEPLDSVAGKLCTTVEAIREFELFGWIYTINKNGRCLLPRQLARKTELIVRLRQDRKLTPRQIGEILSAQSSPYSAEELPGHSVPGKQKGREQKTFRVHTIRAGDRTYSFLSVQSKCVYHDGRQVFFVRTLSGVERIEIQPHETVLYLGSSEHLGAHGDPLEDSPQLLATAGSQ